MSPGTHQPHHRHPPRALVQEIAHGIKIRDGLYHVGEQFHFVARLRHHPPGEQIVRGLVFVHAIGTEGRVGFSRHHDGLTKHEFHAVQLPGHQNAGKKIGNHADRLQFLNEFRLFGGGIQRGRAAHFRIPEGVCDGAQIIRGNANIAVGNHQQIVFRFIHQPHQTADFVVDGVALGAEDQPNIAFGKIAHQFFQHRQSRIVSIHAEKNFVYGIILAAKAGVILVGVLVQTFDRFQATDGRKEVVVVGVLALRHGKIARRAVQRQQVINKRNGGDGKNHDGDNRQIENLKRIGLLISSTQR